MRRCLLAVTLLVALAVPPAAGALPRFYGTVGPGTILTLKRGDGTAVKNANAGAKTFIIRDRASNHNFHLVGPGVDRKTRVGFVGRKRWSPVQLSNGTYTFLCDRHPTTMRKTFTVG